MDRCGVQRLLRDLSSPPPAFGTFPLEKGGAEAGFAAPGWLVAAAGWWDGVGDTALGAMGSVIRELLVAPGESPSPWTPGFLLLRTTRKAGRGRKGGLFFCIHLQAGAGGGGPGGGAWPCVCTATAALIFQRFAPFRGLARSTSQ